MPLPEGKVTAKISPYLVKDSHLMLRLGSVSLAWLDGAGADTVHWEDGKRPNDAWRIMITSARGSKPSFMLSVPSWLVLQAQYTQMLVDQVSEVILPTVRDN